MANTALPASSLGSLLAAAAPTGVAVAAVFDTLGMPMSLVAAKGMTGTAIQAALGRAIAQLHHEPVGTVSATAPMDSIEVVFLIGRFYRNLGRKQPDLSKIDRDQWSTLEGVAGVLHEAVAALT